MTLATTPMALGQLHAGPAFIALHDIQKSFGPTRALAGVGLALRRGRVHALVGENGAGKSTLIQILAGVYQPDAGEILLEGRPVHFSTPGAAKEAGVSVVYQELSLLDDLDVAQNVYLHREPRRLSGLLLDGSALYRTCAAFLEEIGVEINPRARVSSLSVAQRQLVEIAKALSEEATLVIMDEPTASLTSVEEERLFAIIRQLCERNRAVLYVSHRLDEIFEIADELTVLKDGQLVTAMPVATTTHRELASLMVGRELVGEMFPERPASIDHSSTPALGVRSLSAPGRVTDVSFDVWPGEIVGLAGLIGAGRTSLLRAIFGADDAAVGTVTVAGEPIAPAPDVSLRAGIGFVSEDRKLEGLALGLSNLANLTATTVPGRRGVYDAAAARRVAADAANDVQLTARLDAASRSLSGGNQQKVVVAKWLATKPRILLCDEPTRGIDVGAKAEIYALLRRLAAEGTAIVVASSELPELLGLTDRIIVMREGRAVAELSTPYTTEEEIMAAATIGEGET